MSGASIVHKPPPTLTAKFLMEHDFKYMQLLGLAGCAHLELVQRGVQLVQRLQLAGLDSSKLFLSILGFNCNDDEVASRPRSKTGPHDDDDLDCKTLMMTNEAALMK